MHEIACFKVAVVGESLVGKTSIIKTLLTGGTQFSKNYVMTSDVVVNVKDITFPDTKDVVELLLCDSAGNPLYEDFLPKFWKELNAAIVVFDVTSDESFKAVRKWADMIKIVKGPSMEGSADNSIPGVIFANKIDQKDSRVVSPEQGKLVASHLGYEYFEGSAKNNVCVEEAFHNLAKELYNKALIMN